MKLNHVNLRRKYRMTKKLPTRIGAEDSFTLEYVIWLEKLIIKNQKIIEL